MELLSEKGRVADLAGHLAPVLVPLLEELAVLGADLLTVVDRLDQNRNLIATAGAGDHGADG